jgi:hypothetical protein
VLEASLAKGCLPPSINADSFRSPFKTEWPTIPSDDEVKRFEKDKSWARIISSVRTESMGSYGDFGRYVMDAEVHHFTDIPLSNSPPSSRYQNLFPSTSARRWILQRVKELGWSGDRFGEYERNFRCGRQHYNEEELKLERISKKYQWIALREFTGFLADHYWLDQSWKDMVTHFDGAWQLYAREFDPSQRLVDRGNEDPVTRDARKEWEKVYPDLFEDSALCGDRGAWVAQHPPDFARLLRVHPGSPNAQQPWLVLAGHHSWVEPEYELFVSGHRGSLKMWVNVRSFLMRKEDRKCFVARASKKHFYGVGCRFPEEHSGWIGEYPWGKAFAELRYCCEQPDARVEDVGIPYAITACDWNGGSTLIPSPQLCDSLGIEWAGAGGTFRDKTGEEIIGHLGGDGADWGRPLIVRQDSLRTALDAAGLELVWCVLAERSCWCSETTSIVSNQQLEVSAVYWLDRGSIRGGLTQTVLQQIGGK